MSDVVSWLTTVPVTDGNWISNSKRATVDDLQQALVIARELNMKGTGHKTRVSALESIIRRRRLDSLPNEEVLNRLKQLREAAAYHGHRYYTLDDPEISDADYDRMYRELVDLESKYPEMYDPLSPTQRVGGKILEGFEKVTHAVQMQSLQDAFSFQELKDFDSRVKEEAGSCEYVEEPKIDGLSCSLTYEHGKLVLAATRGDGEVGENVTANVVTIESVPLVLKKDIPLLVVRGEVYIPKVEFDRINEEQERNGLKTYANSRNLAAGSLRQLDPKVTASRKLDILIFNIQRIEGYTFSTHSESLDFLKELGFKVNSYTVCKDIDKAWEEIEYLGRNRELIPFDIDGACLKVNNLEARERMGSTSKVPKWAMAYKYPPERKPAVVQDIIISIGRTGVLAPTAVVSPIRLAGTTVSRATLNNAKYIKDKDIRVGDVVFLEKAGDIIPRIVEVDFSKRNGTEQVFEMPDVCPECGAPVVCDEEAAYRCTGIACPAQLLRLLEHYASREALNIEGLGPSIIETFHEKGLLNGIADLYILKDKKQTLIAIDRMGEKSVDNLLQAIEGSKDNSVERLIYGFGIRNVGLQAAKELARHFKSIDRIMAAGFEDIKGLPEFGEVTARCIVDFFSQEQTKELIERLRSYGVRMSADEKESKDARFTGMTFVLTGELSSYSRGEATSIIESMGGKVSGSVSKKTSYVLVGDAPGSKYGKAKELGVSIIYEEDFKSMIFDFQLPWPAGTAEQVSSNAAPTESPVAKKSDPPGHMDLLSMFNNF